MKYLKSLIEHLETLGTLEHWTQLQKFEYNLFYIFLVFVLVYRWGVNRKIYLHHPGAKKIKFIYCSTCFAFWLTLLLSTNVLTAMMAFLIFSFYEKD
jgi:hypothetical protein